MLCHRPTLKKNTISFDKALILELTVSTQFHLIHSVLSTDEKKREITKVTKLISKKK
jgi:hypothetical protein